MNNNNAVPFEVGEEVICVDDNWPIHHSPAPIRKNVKYIIGGITKGCCCWIVDIGLYDGHPTYKCRHCYTGGHRKLSLNFWLDASRFRRLTPQYANISASLASQVEIGDGVDVVKIKEPLKQ